MTTTPITITGRIPGPQQPRTATLPLVEAFGPTLQGEGPAAGRTAAFIRFGGCNLSCQWCDSAYTWDADQYDLRAEITPTSVATILEHVPHPDRTPLVVLTGGEPLLHQDNPAWSDLLHALNQRGHTVHVETNGTRAPNPTSRAGITTFIVSPKLANAGDHRGNQDPTLHPDWPQWAHALDAHLKIVCNRVLDVEHTATLATRWGWPVGRVWVMPEGTTRDELNNLWPAIAHHAATLGLNASHRLHTLAWGDERGH